MDGIVAPIFDPVSGAIPGPAFLDLLDALSPTPLAIRGGIAAAADDTVNTTMIRASIDNYAARGHEVVLTLEQGLCRYQDLHPGDASLLPNAALGRGMNGQSDPLLNPFVDRWTLVACEKLNAIGPANIAGLFIDNEVQLASTSLLPGQLPPAPAPAALSAPVYGAMLYQAVERLHALVPWTKQIPIYPAPFSALVAFYHNEAGMDPFFGDYYRAMIATLTAAGKTPTLRPDGTRSWNWTGCAVNAEGIIIKTFGGDANHTYADFLYAYITKLKSELHMEGPTVSGEYGVMNIGMQAAVVSQIHGKVSQYSPIRFWYQFPLIYPGNWTDYGLIGYGLKGGLFVPTGKASLYDVLQGTYHAGQGG